MLAPSRIGERLQVDVNQDRAALPLLQPMFNLTGAWIRYFQCRPQGQTALKLGKGLAGCHHRLLQLGPGLKLGIKSLTDKGPARQLRR